jgi:four helix bundle protein
LRTRRGCPRAFKGTAGLGSLKTWRSSDGIVSAIQTCVPSAADELAARAKCFAVRVLKFMRTLPHEIPIDAVARQLAKSGPSVSANYRSARRARSRVEFIARLGIVADEADESEHWLEVLRESELANGPELDWLIDESRELRAIFVRSVTTARANRQS